MATQLGSTYGGETDGTYLVLDRDVEALGIDEESGVVIVAAVKPESFNRGGLWSAGEA